MKVSVIVTSYNIEQFLPKALESIQKQTYKPYEVILVDDASTDSCPEICKNFTKNSQLKVTYIQKDENEGPGAARNSGLQRVSGDFVMFLDGDDWIDIDFIEELVKEQERTDADIVSAGITIIKSEGGRRADAPAAHISEGIAKYHDYQGDNRIIYLNNKLVRKSLYEHVGNKYCTRRYCEDTPVVVPLIYHANKIAYVEHSGYYYRQHASSVCHTITRFEDHLYKALCAKDLIGFFADKPEEYKPLVPVSEFTSHLAGMKQFPPTEEELQKYSHEITEIMMWFLNNLLNFS